jgi:hypothetical protein
VRAPFASLDPPAPAGTPRQSWSCSCSRVGFELLGAAFGDFPILSSFKGIFAHAMQLLIFVACPPSPLAGCTGESPDARREIPAARSGKLCTDLQKREAT